ncbi:hypothetical protein GCM10018789_61750 [Streptomyces werraensis]|nr:hypothetical protein GCM10018789_61750 [Streptomyces werraensis]
MGAGGTPTGPAPHPPTATGMPDTVCRRLRAVGGRSRSSPRPFRAPPPEGTRTPHAACGHACRPGRHGWAQAAPPPGPHRTPDSHRGTVAGCGPSGAGRAVPRTPAARYRISKPAASATSSGGTATNPSSAPDANSR